MTESMNSMLKNQVRALVDELPEEELPAARRYLEFLRDHSSDSYTQLEQEDELDDEERQKLHASLKRGLAEAEAGQGRPVEDFLAELEEP